MSFDTLGLTKPLLKAVFSQNYVRPYPIQKKAIPAILEGKDILGIANTGSGKTASYVLPILEKMHDNTGSNNRYIGVLVLVPTRELAIQVQTVFKTFSSTFLKPVKSLAVYGGVSINPQMKALQGTDILIATPGRLLELEASNALRLSSTSILVLDEADKMLNLGFKDEIDRIFSLLPQKRQNLLFSATLSNNVEKFNQVLLNNPLVIQIDNNLEGTDKDISGMELIDQVAYFVKDEKKGPLLRYLIKKNNFKQVLVFTSSVRKADNVTEKLCKNGIDAIAIHSKKSQGARTSTLQKFKSGKVQVLVATDLLSRGIDIQILPCVINYELPRSAKDYVHRIGRTGRAGSQGKAISFITTEDLHHFKIIQKKIGQKIEMIEDFEL